MSKLEKAIVSIVEIFEELADTDHDKQLSNTKLSTLIMNQLKGPEFQNKIDQEDICEALKKINNSQDGMVNMEDFSQSVAILAQGYIKHRNNNRTVFQ